MDFRDLKLDGLSWLDLVDMVMKLCFRFLDDWVMIRLYNLHHHRWSL